MQYPKKKKGKGEGEGVSLKKKKPNLCKIQKKQKTNEKGLVTGAGYYQVYRSTSKTALIRK